MLNPRPKNKIKVHLKTNNRINDHGEQRNIGNIGHTWHRTKINKTKNKTQRT
jgi:hypothetical protein